MQVTAISTPRYPEWRWRITGYAGEIVEAQLFFATVAGRPPLTPTSRSPEDIAACNPRNGAVKMVFPRLARRKHA
jgi:hypothetical protein